VCFHAHPDHVRVHVVGVRAAELAGVTHVYEATVNRDHMVRLMASNPQWAAEAAPPDVAEFGLPESEITTVVDVRAAMGAKREAMAAARKPWRPRYRSRPTLFAWRAAPHHRVLAIRALARRRSES